VKEYHRHHPLEAVKRGVHQGTKKLIRALQFSAPSPSPTQRVKAWLLNSMTLPLHTPVALQSTSKCSPSPPTSPWQSMPSKLSRRRFQELPQKMPGNSYRSLPTLCELMLETDGALPILAEKLATVALQGILLKMAQQASSPKTPRCTMLPSSGHGHPL